MFNHKQHRDHESTKNREKDICLLFHQIRISHLISLTLNKRLNQDEFSGCTLQLKPRADTGLRGRTFQKKPQSVTKVEESLKDAILGEILAPQMAVGGKGAVGGKIAFTKTLTGSWNS